MKHGDYVVHFLDQMAREAGLRTPVSLVNEFNSSMEAKAIIAKKVQQQQHLQLVGGSSLAIHD